MWQKLAGVLEAVLWEHAKAIADGRRWHHVSNDIVEQVKVSWPATLCTPEQAAQVGVKIEVGALT